MLLTLNQENIVSQHLDVNSSHKREPEALYVQVCKAILILLGSEPT